MNPQSKVIIFGDQAVDPCPLVKQLCRSSTNSMTLQAILQKTTDTLRRELALAEPSDRPPFLFFDFIPGLVEAYSQSGKPDEAVATALLCVYQLGLLLTYVLL